MMCISPSANGFAKEVCVFLWALLAANQSLKHDCSCGGDCGTTLIALVAVVLR